jgi:hypothetical protein
MVAAVVTRQQSVEAGCFAKPIHRRASGGSYSQNGRGHGSSRILGAGYRGDTGFSDPDLRQAT